MKKILVTGMNHEQTRYDGYLSKRIGVILCHYGLIRCLEDMDFEVTQKHTQPGEDLSEYDHVIVYLHSPNGFCQRIFDGLWALNQRPDAILAFDDWQVKDIWNGVIGYGKALKERPESAYRGHILDQYHTVKDVDQVKKYHQAYIDAIDMVAEKKNKVLMCAFAGGDLSKLMDYPQELVYSFNPNPYHLNRSWSNNYGMESGGLDDFFGGPEEPSPKKKSKAWIFSSLVQTKTRKWLDKLELNWETRIYGAQRGAYKTERLTEDKMVQEYETTWGNLMPGYDHAGSGWWRTRVLQCAEARSITICDPAEGKVYGEEFLITPAEVEAMDDDQLWKKANAQRENFLDNHPLNKDITKQEIMEVLNG